MTSYENEAVYGGVAFSLGDVDASTSLHTIKSQLGKNLVENTIPLSNKIDNIFSVIGVIEGNSRTFGQTKEAAIQVDRDALLVLEDGYYHSWDDGKHTGNYVIMKGTLKFSDGAGVNNNPNRFVMTVKEWEGH